MWKPIEFREENGKRRMLIHLPWKKSGVRAEPSAPNSPLTSDDHSSSEEPPSKRLAKRLAAAKEKAIAADEKKKSSESTEPERVEEIAPETSPQKTSGKLSFLSTMKGKITGLFHKKKIVTTVKPVVEKKPTNRFKMPSFKRFKKKEKKRNTPRTILHRRRALEQYLLKAGFEFDTVKVYKWVFYASLATISIFTIFSFLYGAVGGANPLKMLIFYMGLWGVVFWLVFLVYLMFVYVYLDLRIYSRTKELEDVLPDFLELASANISAGMPIDRALWFAVRPNFGVLAHEIEEVAKSTIAGEDLSKSLEKFTHKYDSVLLKRSINILLEGISAGGEIADLLDKIALNIQETRILRQEMSASVATYAIFITFASVVMAPILFGLATQLLQVIISIMGLLDMSGSTNNFLSLQVSTDPKAITNFKWFSVFMLTITSTMSAAIVSVIRKGKVREGMHNLPIFIGVSLVIYAASTWVLGKFLGGLF